MLSALRLDALLDIHGKEFQIPEFSLPVPAQRVRQGGGWRIEDSVFHRHSYLEFIPGPFMLEPDDVITMRLRARPGIDWSAKWTVARIGQLALSLQNPIVAAFSKGCMCPDFRR